jgi:benzoate/toluate 1,2-dioxygenase reductase subunit
VSLLTVPVADVVAITPRSRLLRLGIDDDALAFLPGQAVMAAAHGRDDRRPYSIACSPEHAAETGVIELLVAAEGGESASHLSQATAGAVIDIEGPLGQFTFPEEVHQQRVLFVAGGTGIAPLRAMLDHALRRDDVPAISLLYSARRGDEFAFIDELRTHARERRIELHQTVTRDESTSWEGSRGRIGRTHFESVLHEPGATLCFVCGPSPLVTESVATLTALGVPGALIRTEQWGK